MLEGILGNSKPTPCITKAQIDMIRQLSGNDKLYSAQEMIALIIGLNTGINRQELFKVSKSDVNMDANTIYIRGEKKSRMVYLTPSAMKQLRPFIVKHNGSPDNLIKLSDEEYKQMIQRWSSACGIDITWQTIRHTYAELAADHGLPIKLVSHNIGVEEKTLNQHFDLTPAKIQTMLKDKVLL